MSRWVDRELRQGVGVEQVLTGYHLTLQGVGLHQLRGPVPCRRAVRIPQSISFSPTHRDGTHAKIPV